MSNDWLSRESAALAQIEGRIAFFSHWGERNRKWHRVTAIVTLVCSVLAPIAVVSQPGVGLGLFGLSPDALKGVALVVTVTLALADGIRRLFRFEDRWALCARSRERLLWLKDDYMNEQIGRDAGSDEWKVALRTLRASLADVISAHVDDFAKGLRDPMGAHRTAQQQRQSSGAATHSTE